MKISEIFYSVQAEGLNLGMPAVFVRLAGCNKRCSFCDSKYSWIDDTEMTIDEVIKEARKYNCRNIVLTGGEPLCQQTELIQFMEQLLCISLFYHFEIETNATLAPQKRLAELTDLFTVSPKFEDFEYAEAFSHIEDLAERPQVVFKFVVDKPEDMEKILAFDTRFNKQKREVFLMPCTINTLDMIVKLKWLIELAKKYNMRVTPRLQILAYGNKRGT